MSEVPKLAILRESGVSSTPRLLGLITFTFGILDHPLSRVMTAGDIAHSRSSSSKHTFALSRRDAPELCRNLSPKRGRGECRVPGAPAASCAKSSGSMHTSIHSEVAKNIRHPHAMVYGLFRALPGDRALLPPSPAEVASTDLTPASRRQDHTSSPSASVPFVIGTSSVHRIPPRVRDDREPPLRWDGTAG
jgi:hypothetical protein